MHRYADMAFGTDEPEVEFGDGFANVHTRCAVPFVLFDTDEIYDGLGEFMKAGETRRMYKNTL